MNDRPVHIRLVLVSVFVFVALVVGAIAYRLYQGEADEIRAETSTELQLVAQMKVDQLTTWRDARIEDAVVSAAWDVTGATVSRWLESPGDPVLRAEVDRRLRLAERAAPAIAGRTASYDAVILATPDGRLLLAIDRPLHDLGPEEVALVAAVVASGQPAIGDFERFAPGAPADIDVAAPILDASGHAIAAILLSGNAERSLFPALEWWPTRSPTAETVLVQRFGDHVVILNMLRNRGDPPLSIDIPLSATDVPSVAAVLGHVGAFEGTDYRGVPVTAELRPVTAELRQVPASPWFLVTKVDTAEVVAAVNERGLIILPLVALILLVTGGALVLAFSMRQQTLLRRLVMAERERSTTATRYDRIISMARDIVLLVDPDGRIEDANPAAVAAYGYRREELLRLHLRDLRAPDAVADFPLRWQEAGEPGGARFEATQRRKDGSTLPVEVSASPVDVDGQLYRQAFVRDITERRVAEARVSHLTRAYATLAQTNELIVRSDDEATLFAGICRTAVESGGYLGAWVGIPDETTGRIEPVAMAGTIDAYIRTIDVRVDPDDPRGQGPTARAWREDRPQYIGDFQAMAAHGPWHELLRSHGIQAMMALPLRRGGRVVAVQSLYSTDPVAPGEESRSLLEQMAADVSFALDSLDLDVARQAAEQEVLRLNAELEQRVAERTEKLQAANGELRSFSYSVSHDLRAPLRAVAGFAELLNRRYRDRLDDTGAHFLDNILEGSLHMGVLIDQLLDYSRLGRGSVRAEPVPLAPIVEHLRTVFATRIAEAGATLVVSGPLASPQGDPLLLGQVLSNLVDNALTYRRADVPPLITLSSLRRGRTVTVSVADNGIGIAPEHHERIFEVFTRLHGEDEYPGTGIGLATVRKAARLMGSEVTVASVEGEGSTFSLVLPAAQGGGSASALRIRPIPATPNGG